MISVILTFHNQEKFVDRCIHSFTNQHIEGEVEIICVDDSSTDGTASKINAWKKSKVVPKNIKIKSIKVKHKSVTKSRNSGLKKAKGDYICFFDGDDYVREKYLQRLREAIDNNGVDFAYARFTMTGSRKPFERCNFFEYDPLFLEYGNMTNTPSMIKRECLNEVKWDENITVMEDWELSLSLARRGYRGVAVPEYLWHYHVHDQSSWNGGRLNVDYDKVREYIRTKHGIKTKRLKHSLGVMMRYYDEGKLSAIENVKDKWNCHLLVVVNSNDCELLEDVKMRIPYGFASYRILNTNIDYDYVELIYYTMELFMKMKGVSGSDSYTLLK